MKRIIAMLLALLLALSLTAALGEAEDPWPYAIRKGDTESMRIAITMDDCGDISIVEQTFRYCVENEIYITFFPIGVNVRPEDAEVWREIAMSPWAEIGCHTQHHYCWEKCPMLTIGNELDQFCATLDDVLGFHYPVRWVRPPHGHYTTTRDGGNSNTVKKITTEHGFPHVILWNESSVDSAEVLHRLKKGSILLFHAYGKDLRCIKNVVPKALERGFEPVTISMLLGQEKPVPEID